MVKSFFLHWVDKHAKYLFNRVNHCSVLYRHASFLRICAPWILTFYEIVTFGWGLNQRAGSFRFISSESLQDAHGEDIDKYCIISIKKLKEKADSLLKNFNENDKLKEE